MAKSKLINYPESWDTIIDKLVGANVEEKQNVSCAADIWKLAMEEFMKDHGFDPEPFRKDDGVSSRANKGNPFTWSLRKNYGGEVIPIQKLEELGFEKDKDFTYDLLSDKYNFRTRRTRESATTKLRSTGFKLEATKLANEARWRNK